MTIAVPPARTAAVRVRRYAATDGEAVRRLNARFEAAGIHHVLYAENEREQSDTVRPSWVRDRLFVAEQDAEIRAGMWLKEQDFWISGRTVRAGWAKYPVSESLVDKTFAGIPGSLLFQVMREQPRLMALGLGGHEAPFARLLAGMRWPGLTIPFFVRIVRPARVARELTALRTSRARAVLLDLLAYSGVATVGGALHNAWRAMRNRPRPQGYSSTVEDSFGEWADAVWSRCRNHYGFLATRDSAALEQTYTSAYDGVTRLRVDRAGALAGWACLHRMDGRRADRTSPFGDLVVGVLADCLAAPEDAAGVVAEGTRVLLDQEPDLLISHQSHGAWGAALEQTGWLRRPSSFAFYRSPAMETLIASAVDAGMFHLTRGDCDGLMRF